MRCDVVCGDVCVCVWMGVWVCGCVETRPGGDACVKRALPPCVREKGVRRLMESPLAVARARRPLLLTPRSLSVSPPRCVCPRVRAPQATNQPPASAGQPHCPLSRTSGAGREEGPVAQPSATEHSPAPPPRRIARVVRESVSSLSARGTLPGHRPRPRLCHRPLALDQRLALARPRARIVRAGEPRAGTSLPSLRAPSESV